MALEPNYASEDTQSQWVGEATINGKSQVPFIHLCR